MTASDADKVFAGSIPEIYDQFLVPLIFEPYAADLSQRLAAFSPHRILETAAGTGVLTRAIARRLPDADLVATDLNQPMLDRAAAQLKQAKVEWQQADALALPFADQSFDAVMCQFGVMFFPDKPKSYSEVYRVLAPGGRYIFSVWDSHRYNPFGRIAQEVAARFFPADPPQFYSVPFSCHAIDPIKEALIAVGFSDINVAVIRLDKQLPDAANFARAAVYGNPLIDQVRARGGVEPERIVDTLAQEFRREFGADPGRLPLQAIVFSATKPS